MQRKGGPRPKDILTPILQPPHHFFQHTASLSFRYSLTITLTLSLPLPPTCPAITFPVVSCPVPSFHNLQCPVFLGTQHCL
ncbi:mCG147955 [Mus musculus]|nr:mCG147955 [Mus musculus]